jgi:hypothetical protein
MPEASKSLEDALENPIDQDFVDFLKICLEWYVGCYLGCLTNDVKLLIV